MKFQRPYIDKFMFLCNSLGKCKIYRNRMVTLLLISLMLNMNKDDLYKFYSNDRSIDLYSSLHLFAFDRHFMPFTVKKVLE